jgi:hypothetical protein
VKLSELEPMLFSPGMTYRHSYPGTLDLVLKQFRRASQMVQLPQRTVLGSSLLFRWRFKIGHILSAVIVATAFTALFAHAFIYVVIPATLLKITVNRYLFTRSLVLKGPVFALYVSIMSLTMGVSVVCGAVYGMAKRGVS